MNALVLAHHARSSSELFSELVDSVAALNDAVHEIGDRIADGDRLALERLERLAERFSGLHRHTGLTRQALANEFRSPEAA